MQHIELLNYENLTLKTVEKMAVFAVLTFVLKSHGKTELSNPEVHLFFYMQRFDFSCVLSSTVVN